MLDLSVLHGLGQVVEKFVEGAAHGKIALSTLAQEFLITLRLGRRLRMISRIDRGCGKHD